MSSPYREVFSLFLYSASSRGYVIDSTNYGATQYSVNWDALFNGRNKMYKSCYVRIRMIGNGDIARNSVANATGTVSLVGLSSSRTFGNEMQGLVVAPFNYGSSSVISATENGYFITIDTTTSNTPPQTVPPQGISPLTVLMSQENGSVMANANLSPYSITIFFELFDPINP